MDKKRVLFVCVHNSARSQMAESLLKQLAGDKFEVESAGLKPGELNPVAIEVMKEIGIDISANKTKSVSDLFKQGKRYDFVITVCDESQSGQCPVFPGAEKMLHWSLKDPSGFKGTQKEKLGKTRRIREQLKHNIEISLLNLHK